MKISMATRVGNEVLKSTLFEFQFSEVVRQVSSLFLLFKEILYLRLVLPLCSGDFPTEPILASCNSWIRFFRPGLGCMCQRGSTIHTELSLWKHSHLKTLKLHATKCPKLTFFLKKMFPFLSTHTGSGSSSISLFKQQSYSKGGGLLIIFDPALLLAKFHKQQKLAEH